jgi:hypothetical protein
MADLKKNFSLLVIYLLMVFSLGHLPFEGERLIDFQIDFYVVMAAAIIVTLVAPGFRSLSIYSLLFFWGVISIVSSLLFFPPPGNLLGGLWLISFLFVEVGVWVVYHLSQSLDSVETLVQGLANRTYPNRSISINEAEERIDTEFSRSRRHNRPLTLLMVQPERITGDEQEPATFEMRKDLLQNFAYARIGQIIADSARQTDLIVHDSKEGIFFVLCAETEWESSHTLGERIRQNIMTQLKTSASWSAASFPKDAVTMDELIITAQGRLQK